MDRPLVKVRYSEDVHPFTSHFHDCHQLLYVVRGAVRVTVGERPYLAGPGSLVVISRLEPHDIRIESPEYLRYTVTLQPDLQGYDALLGETLLSVLVNRPAGFQHMAELPDKGRAEAILAQMAEESERSGRMRERMLLLLLSQLLVLFCRSRPESIPENTGNLWLIQQVRQHIEENFAAKCVLEDLAKQFHLSSSYLSHLFKQVTGSSVIGYLTACRIAAAKRCLAETDQPVGSIAASCGFSDHSNFGRTFRAMTGMTPKAFRETFGRK